MEQRTDETAWRPGVAAEDTGPPGDEQPGTAPAADQTAETDGHTAETQSGWESAGQPARDRGAGSAFPSSSPGSFGSSPASSAGGSPASPGAALPVSGGQPSTAYPADSAYSGNTADDGYGPPGSERATTQDFPSSSVASQTFGASPAEDIYGSSDQRDYSPSPYPSQVTTPRPRSDDPRSPAVSAGPPGPSAPSARAPAASPSAPSAGPSAAETTRVDRPSAWQAATSRMPRPQQAPKPPKAEPKAQKANKARSGNAASARQAHLMVSRFEPWSVMKFSFMISLACFVILFVAVALLYTTLSGLGVFDAIQKALTNVTSGQGTGGVNISHYLSASTVLSYTALLGVLNVFLITAFATVGSLVYNLTAHLIGGVEVTLRETE